MVMGSSLRLTLILIVLSKRRVKRRLDPLNSPNVSAHLAAEAYTKTCRS